MSRHVDHSLAAYVNGQLSPGDASRVYQHLRACRSCRARLDSYEQMSSDLRAALGSQVSAKPGDIQRWWRAVSQSHTQPARPNWVLVFAPTLLVIAVLGLPLITSLSSLVTRPAAMSQSQYATRVSTQLAADQPVAGLIPQPEHQDQSTAIIATAAPQENVVTAAPAPLAPSIQ